MSESGRERNPSKFLVGTAIPNSVIQADLNKEEPVPKDKETLRKERDEYVAQVCISNQFKSIKNYYQFILYRYCDNSTNFICLFI